jgi:aspartokinase/homoserine dehydrogenase 1
MIVLKFGGTSVANAENISKTISIVTAAMKKDKLMVVVSALGGPY